MILTWCFYHSFYTCFILKNKLKIKTRFSSAFIIIGININCGKFYIWEFLWHFRSVFELRSPHFDRSEICIPSRVLKALTSLEREGSTPLEHWPEALARRGELALGHLHVVGDVLVQEALVPVLLLRPLAVTRVDQGHEVSLVSLLPFRHAGHPLHWQNAHI